MWPDCHRPGPGFYRASAPLRRDTFTVPDDAGARRGSAPRYLASWRSLPGAAWKETDACPLPASDRLRRPGPACPLLGRRAGLRARAAPDWSSPPGTTTTATSGCPRRTWVSGRTASPTRQGHGPRIWFQVVPDAKAVKNRLHLDIHASGGRTDPIETRRQRVDAEASRLRRPGRHHHRRHVPGRARPLRGRDDGPGGQRVRYQLTSPAAAAPHGGPAVTPAPASRCRTA